MYMSTLLMGLLSMQSNADVGSHSHDVQAKVSIHSPRLSHNSKWYNVPSRDVCCSEGRQ